MNSTEINQALKRPPTRVTRRGLLKASFLGGAGLVGWATLVEPRWYEVNRFPLAIPNLPYEWHGKQIVQVSDLHTGRVPVSYLQDVMQTVNALQPDVLVITGDLVDQSCQLEDDELSSVLEVLQPARIASLACLGNHDYGPGWRHLDVAQRVSEIARLHGIEVLRNQIVDIQGVDFCGLDDFQSPRFGPQSTLQQVNSQRATICLCHNPDACDVADWTQLAGAILAGHTHGGQCKPPFLPPPLLALNNRRYAAGFFELDQHRQLFVSKGIGHGWPVRFNCRPEICVFKLQTA